MTAPEALLVDDPRFDAHALPPGGYHPERPERLTAARASIAKADVSWQRVPAREATDEELGRVHAKGCLEALERMRGEEGYLDPDTYVAPGSVAAARLAAGAVVDMVDRMVSGSVAQGVALVRPPGHHARPGQAMGFCLLNTVAVAAAHAVALGLERVLVIDWDVHHGNGTQEAFWRSAKVLYASTHQYPFYPGTGAVSEQGETEGTGFTVNVPLSAGGGDDVYRAAFERVLLPIARAYAPELVLVSAGFDASARDPLANMTLTADAFGWMGRALREVADASAKGRIALVLEGGYDLVALEAGLTSSIRGVVGGETATMVAARDGAEVDRAARAAGRVWTEVR
jgi:acetoin utilization deacetylase AcuC-like enzyme